MNKKIKKFESDFLNHAGKVMGERRYSKALQKGQIKASELRLKTARKLLGLNQSDMKGMSQPEISKIEGRKDMKISTLDKYARALGMRLKINLITEDDDTIPIPIYG